MKKKSKERWFWAQVIQMTHAKKRSRKSRDIVEVWDNLIIVRARHPKEAIAKALKVGEACEGDCRGSLRLDGKPATTKFLGLAAMGLIHDGLEDGGEITWWQKRCQEKTARGMVEPLRKLTIALKKEASPVRPLKGAALREIQDFMDRQRALGNLSVR
jgi:hypothetical protein